MVVESIDQSKDDVGIVQPVHRRAELGRTGQPAGVPGHVLARQAHARIAAEIVEDRSIVRCQHIFLLCEGRFCMMVASAQEMHHLGDEPRPSVAASLRFRTETASMSGRGVFPILDMDSFAKVDSIKETARNGDRVKREFTAIS